MAVRDVIFITAIIFVMAIVFLIFNSVMTTTTNTLVNTPALNASDQAVESFQSIKTQIDRLDYILLIIFIGLSLGIVITGWFVGSEPVFMIIYFIIITITIILAAVLSNSWETISTLPIFSGNIADFPITNHLMNLLPYYISIVSFMGMIALFARPKQ